MAQYRPLYRACEHPAIASRVSAEWYAEMTDLFTGLGFGGFFQEHRAMNERFVIDFEKRKRRPLTGED